MIGQTVSHYKILEELGGGGMGVVYKAEDTKLERAVALKFLHPELTRDPDAKKRFVREAKAASALQHHNICTIHEIDETDDGRMFISMDYYEGETLKQMIARERLPGDDAIDIAIQIAEGLAKAHDAGMVHRDIKTANIMITSDGVVKILDFGLAKLAGQTKVTKTGMTVGTVAYMSPEQAQGSDINERTDIWSLGVVLYELLTEHLPFPGDHEAAVIYGIINTDPDSLEEHRTDLPERLQDIIDKCLAKDVDERYQTISHLITDLYGIRSGVSAKSPLPRPGILVKTRFGLNPRRVTIISVAALVILIVVMIGLNIGRLRDRMLTLVGMGDTGAIRSLAILPFVNMGSDPDTDYLSDEIPASIINNLSQLSHLRVISRSSAFHFKNRQGDLGTVGEKLDVGAVLIGQITIHGDQLNIRAELVDVDNDRQLWGDRYIGTLDDILSTEEEIVTKISDALRLQLTGEEQDKLAKRHTENSKAHRLYLKGRYYWNKRTEEDFYKAIDYFEQAINESPDYALAYAGLAETYALFVDYGIMPSKDAYPKAKATAQKAIEIDEELAEPYTALGYVLTFGDRDWEGAEKRYKRAVELNPNYANAHHWYAILLYILGRSDEALSEINRAQEIDPLLLIMKATKADVLRFARRYEEAVDECREAIEMDPNYGPVLFALGRTYRQMQMYTEALSVFKDSGLPDLESEDLAVTYALAGMDIEARKALEELAIMRKEGSVVSLTMIAMVHMGLGEKNRAFEYLELAFETQDFGLVFIGVDPAWDPLRDDPRFIDLIRRLGLESTLASAP